MRTIRVNTSRAIHLALAMGALTACSCAHSTATVTDPANHPVSGAKVLCVSPSISGPTLTTDTQGHVTIPFAIQPVQWLEVTKEGYRSEHVDLRTHSRPIRITLVPAKNGS